jgi:hypothetical protein
MFRLILIACMLDASRAPRTVTLRLSQNKVTIQQRWTLPLTLTPDYLRTMVTVSEGVLPVLFFPLVTKLYPEPGCKVIVAVSFCFSSNSWVNAVSVTVHS